MLTVAELTYRIGGRTLLEAASAQINAGWKVGLVGRNGSGKSTLLDLIRAELQPDAGAIQLQKGLRLGFVAKEAPGGSTTPLEAVLAADTERHALIVEAETAEDPHRIAEIHTRLADIDAHAAPARAAEILDGLGFDHAAQQQPLSSFSGGWRMRVALAAALFAEPDLLLLDEPTNHLDLEAALWLEAYLKAWRRTLLIVSHDRQILNAVCDHILHLDDRKLVLYSGGYDTFQKTRRERQEQREALAAKQATQRAHLQSFIDRFRAKASKARQAQSRLKALARMEPIAAIVDDPTITFNFPEPETLAPPILTFDDVAVGYAADTPVLRGLNLRLDPDDRIALLGANGNGKSTLAKLIAGRLSPLAGRETRHPKLRCGFFAQHQIEDLMPEETPLQHLAALMPEAPPAAVRARLGRFGFSQEKALVKVQDLSGGEKARLNFALVTHFAPPLLILDEPTNHLDIEAREALVQAINDFTGAVLVISHDWHLVELVADRLWVVADGTARPYAGDLEDYRRELLERRSAAARNGKAPTGERAAGERKEARRAAAERRRELGPLRRRTGDAEKRVERLTTERQRLERTLADPTTYDGGADVTVLLQQQADLDRQLAEAESAWLDLAQALEEAMQEGEAGQ
jgi:ATP-binding cassette subfamily F protein 3